MKNLVIITLVLLAAVAPVNAQKKIRTPDGKTVLLFDNGTWKYEEVKKKPVQNAPLRSKKEIDKAFIFRDVELKPQTVIQGVSEKLAKFSKTQNQVKSEFQIASKGGKVILKTNWKIMDEEGFRFFGFITKTSKMIFTLSNGELVELQYRRNFEPKEYPNYKFTTYTAELEINPEQIRRLQKGYLQKVDMIWSRRTESYMVFNPDYFINELPKIIQ
ncbi:hypothetical protein [Labilibaculum sp.]|uniref:hypothetical protein n=1 Tax=Labilibaculum sp. TaxID=2060723 RepID=UPI00356A82F3